MQKPDPNGSSSNGGCKGRQIIQCAEQLYPTPGSTKQNPEEKRNQNIKWNENDGIQKYISECFP